MIRSQARTRRSKRESNGSVAPRAAKDAETRLIAAASEIGISRSIEILTAEKARLTRLLR